MDQPLPSAINDALLRLLAPSSIYRATLPMSPEAKLSDLEWKREAEEVIDGLSFDVELSINPQYLPEEVSDLTGEAVIQSSSRTKAVSQIQQLGLFISQIEENKLHRLQRSLVLDLENITPVLFGPKNRHIRQLEASVDVASEWLEAIDRVDAFSHFLHHAKRSLTGEDMEWFLSKNPSPSSDFCNLNLHAVVDCVAGHFGHSSSDNPEHLQALVKWCARSKNWKNSKSVASAYLYNALVDPEKRLCQAMEQQGYKFSIDKVSWRTVLVHLNYTNQENKVCHAMVEKFLVNHAQTLAQGWPKWADQPNPQDMAYSRFTVKNFEVGSSLRGMLINIEKDSVRDGIEALINQAVLQAASPNASFVRSRRSL